MKQCSVEGCECKHYAKNYCIKHYKQFKRYGKIFERTIYDLNDYIIENDIVRMNCYNQKNEKSCEFIFDLEDLEKIKNKKWCLNNEEGYISTVINRKTIFFHNFIFNDNKTGHAMKRDHINRNKLDNRKCNLRLVSNSLNNMNKGIQKNNNIGFKGVCVKSCKPTIKYVAQISFNKKKMYLGYYDTPEEASVVYEKKCRELYGEYYTDNI